MHKRVQCYMCESPSTSKEHVPPRSIFPEQKDSAVNHRKNLITVPSCDLHNSLKSDDDEFLMVSLAGLIGNNSIGYKHKFTKVNRAIYRSAFSLLNQAMTNQKWQLIEIAPNKFLDVLWGTPDYERLNKCFDRIARGLFYSQTTERFLGETKIIFTHPHPDSANTAELQRLIRDKVELELKGKERCGANPEVFSFQFTDSDRFGLRSLHLQFYGGLNIYVALIPKGTVLPYDLGMDLMNRGLHTIVTLDSNEYRFNLNAETPDEHSADGTSVEPS